MHVLITTVLLNRICLAERFTCNKHIQPEPSYRRNSGYTLSKLQLIY